MSGIVALGACVFDTLYTVANYPDEDTKMRADSVMLSGGGPAATGLVAASKLGCESAFIGNLSDDNAGRFLMDDFGRYGVNTSYIGVVPSARSFMSTIFLSSSTASRTCVYDRGTLPPLTLNVPQKDAIKNASVLLVDGNETAAACDAAKTANESGTVVLYDADGMYDGIDELLPMVDVLIPSERFALTKSGLDDVKAAAKWLYNKYSPSVVVVTQGANGGVMYDGEEIYEYPCYKVQAVDSNGAGDVFHGAFAAGIDKGYDYKKCCHFASAVSALKCTGIGARASAPDMDKVISFLKENGYEL